MYAQPAGRGEQETEDIDDDEEELELVDHVAPTKSKIHTREQEKQAVTLTPVKESSSRRIATADVRDPNSSPSPTKRSGTLLGDLPPLQTPSPNKARLVGGAANDFEMIIEPDTSTALTQTSVLGKSKSKRRGDGDPGSGGRARKQKPAVPKDTPQEFLCELTLKLMSDPVRSPYGHVYDRKSVENWIQKQGHVCPLTGPRLSHRRDFHDRDHATVLHVQVVYCWLLALLCLRCLSRRSIGCGGLGGGDQSEGSHFGVVAVTCIRRFGTLVWC